MSIENPIHKSSHSSGVLCAATPHNTAPLERKRLFGCLLFSLRSNIAPLEQKTGVLGVAMGLQFVQLSQCNEPIYYTELTFD